MVDAFPDDQGLIQSLLEIFPHNPIRSLARPPPGPGDQATDLGISLLAWCQQYQPEVFIDQDLAADDEFQAAIPGCFVGPHHAGHRAFVGQCQCLIAESACLPDQLIGQGGGSAEAEGAQGMQFGIGMHGESITV